MKENENPLISIIVPMYNCKDYAKVCIEHIVNQTYPYWELLLVNGVSTDGTTELCDEYANSDERITSIHNIDGLVQARNIGFEHAIGDWIMYVDGDDWINIETLEELINASKRYEDLDVIFYNFIQDFNGKKNQKWKWICNDNEHLYTGEECMMLSNHTLYYKSGIYEAYNKIVRKGFAVNNALFHNKKLRQGIEGTEYSLRVFAKAQRALFINNNYYNYRYNSNSLSQKIDEKDAKYLSDGLLEVQSYINTLPLKFHNDFQKALYERSLYILIAKAMSTYFHPNNKEKYLIRRKKFLIFIQENEVISNAMLNIPYGSFDLLRKIVLYGIANKCFLIVQFMAIFKQYFKGFGFIKY